MKKLFRLFIVLGFCLFGLVSCDPTLEDLTNTLDDWCIAAENQNHQKMLDLTMKGSTFEEVTKKLIKEQLGGRRGKIEFVDFTNVRITEEIVSADAVMKTSGPGVYPQKRSVRVSVYYYDMGWKLDQIINKAGSW